MRFDVFEWSRWRHPRTDQFIQHLESLDFADRYDALCQAHPVRGAKVPVGLQHEAIQNVGRRMYWSKVMRRFMWRETWLETTGLPKYVSIGLDIRIDARVELELLFATPDGHLSGPFWRFLKQIRQKATPEYKHNNPAPRIGSPDELPQILSECLALYDDIANALKSDTWWEYTPKPWLEELQKKEQKKEQKEAA